MASKERLLSLDVMRGITIAAMLLVNNPGSWSNIYAPLRHAAWHGMTPTDLIYPFFVFMMGVSICFSLQKYGDGLNGRAFWKIARRSVLIFAVGLGLQWFSYLCSGIQMLISDSLPAGTTFWQNVFPWERFRIMGVLQGLALAYFFGSLAVLLLRWKHILWLAGAILAIYVVMLQLGNGYELAWDNIIAVVDRAVMGESHLYMERLADGSRLAFEPEGLLSTLPRIAHVLLGVYAGRLITSSRDNGERMKKLFIFGVITLFAGLLLQYGDPLNKKIWSSSFTLATSGFASLTLALLIWIIDVKKCVRWSRFFEVYGVNPLFLYVAGWVVSVLFGMNFPWGVKSFLYGSVLQSIAGDTLASLLWAILFVVIIWVPGYILYRKKIYIKL